MAIFDIGGLTDTIVLNTSSSTYTGVCARGPGILLGLYWDSAVTSLFTIKSYTIDGTGNISGAAISSITLPGSTVYQFSPRMIYLGGNNVAIVATNAGNQGYIWIVGVSSTGVFLGLYDQWDFGTRSMYYPRLIAVAETVLAIAHGAAGALMKIYTLRVGIDGVINRTALSDTTMSNVYSGYVGFCYMHSDYYIAMCTNSVNSRSQFYLFNINPATGVVGSAASSSNPTTTGGTTFTDVIYVGRGGGYLVFAGVVTTTMTIWTLACTLVGGIGAAVLDSLGYAAVASPVGELINIEDKGIAVVFSGVGSDGWMATVELADDGTLPANFWATFEWDTTNGTYPHITRHFPHTYVISACGATLYPTLYAVRITEPVEGVTVVHPDDILSEALATHVFGFLAFGPSEHFYLEFDAFDFSLPGIKFVETVEVSGSLPFDAVMECMVKWRNDKRLPWRETKWKRMNPQFVATPLVAGVEVRICLRIMPPDDVHIDSIAVGWKNVDKRHVRGGYGVAGKTNADGDSG